MIDAIHEECGIAAAIDLGPAAEGALPGQDGNAVRLLPGMLMDIQNRGQLAAGITSYDPGRAQVLRTHKALGSVQKAFALDNKLAGVELLAHLAGAAGIGHTRYSTCGKDDVAYAQPLERPHGKLFKWFSFCFNGNVANHRELQTHLVDDLGYHLLRPDSDTELFMHYLAFAQRGAKAKPWAAVFKRLVRVVDGAWSMCFLSAAGELVVARDPTGLKPLCWGRLGRYVLFASESIALQNLGVREIADVEPGTLVRVAAGEIHHERFAPPRQRSHCFFEWVYFANVASVLDGRSVYQARSNLGKALAAIEEEAVGPDHLVVPVPDTSKAAGDAFAYTLGIPSIEGLVRNRYVGRTFIESDDRAALVRRKFTALRGILEGKKIFLVDDSIVRSTTLGYLIDYIRTEGRAAEIHVRIACPPIMSPCFYGIDMSTIGELFAPRFAGQVIKNRPLPREVRQEMAKALGADSLQYLPPSSIPEAIGRPREELCMACVTKEYPTRCGRRLYQQAVERHKRGERGRTTTAGATGLTTRVCATEPGSVGS